MRLPIGHPDFVYRPTSAATRAKMSAAQRARLAIPNGFRKLFGALVKDDEQYERVKREAYARFNKGRWTLGTYISKGEAGFDQQMEIAGQLVVEDSNLDFELLCELFDEYVSADEIANFYGIDAHHAELKIASWREEMRRRRTGRDR